jgi:hypothetical protein
VEGGRNKEMVKGAVEVREPEGVAAQKERII